MTLARGIGTGEYYHVYNRGAHRHGVFHDRSDNARFLFGLVYFQSPALFGHIGRLARTFDNRGGFEVSDSNFENVLAGRMIELVSFCIMGNHYHLLIRELTEGGIADYMQRVSVAYSKYYNTKYQSSGHVFQGRYQSVHIKDNRQLMYLSAYIHRNPHELKAWRGKEAEYPWSSLHDYTVENRWGGLLAPEIILDQFAGTSTSNYADFVKTSTAKILEDELTGIDLK